MPAYTFTEWNASTHPIVTLQDYNFILAHGLEKAYPYIVRSNGAYYEAISGATGKLIYGGLNGAGSKSGLSFSTVANAALTAGSVLLAAGNFAVDNYISVPSNRTLTGVGKQTILTPSATFPETTFDDLTDLKAVIRNSAVDTYNILVQNLSIVNTNAVEILAGVHIHESSNFSIQNVHTLDCSDGVATTESTDFSFLNNRIEHAENCALDVWQSSSRGLIANNTVIGDGDTSLYGVLITGMNTAEEGVTTEGITIANNTIFNIENIGIWLQGGECTGGGDGVTRNCVVSGNVIDTVNDYYGIRVSDGYGNVVCNNTIKSTAKAAIIFNSEKEAGTQGQCVIRDNIIYDPCTSTPVDAAIYLYSRTGLVTVSGNKILGTNLGGYAIAIQDTSCVDNQILADNYLTTGTVGLLYNEGSNTSLPFFTVPFADGADPQHSGFLIDTNLEYARTYFHIPHSYNQLLYLDVFGRSVVTEADRMNIEVYAYGALDNQPYSTVGMHLTDKESESNNFAADDVIFWRIDAGDAISGFVKGDSVELIVLHEAAAGDNCETNAYIRSARLTYI